MQITAAQVRAVYDTLGLDYDHTLGITITPGLVHVSTVQIDEEGHPVFIGGVVQREETGYPIPTEQGGA